MNDIQDLMDRIQLIEYLLKLMHSGIITELQHLSSQELPSIIILAIIHIIFHMNKGNSDLKIEKTIQHVGHFHF